MVTYDMGVTSGAGMRKIIKAPKETGKLAARGGAAGPGAAKAAEDIESAKTAELTSSVGASGPGAAKALAMPALLKAGIDTVSIFTVKPQKQ